MKAKSSESAPCAQIPAGSGAIAATRQRSCSVHSDGANRTWVTWPNTSCKRWMRRACTASSKSSDHLSCSSWIALPSLPAAVRQALHLLITSTVRSKAAGAAQALELIGAWRVEEYNPQNSGTRETRTSSKLILLVQQVAITTPSTETAPWTDPSCAAHSIDRSTPIPQGCFAMKTTRRRPCSLAAACKAAASKSATSLSKRITRC
mmetsp:Transcript_128527/g.227644  ORF Transcript_128527/g.227644 Transcript_128527/m.227644 type:complete len:206 (+) Transcript_128527:122-739(+)